MKTTYFLLASLSALESVTGHGGVYNYTIGGTHYAGSYPYLYDDEQPASIQRRWFPDPIQDVTHPYLSCNRGNPLATRNPTLHAPIEAGTNISVIYIPPKCPQNIHQPTAPSVVGYHEPFTPFTCVGPDYPWPHYLGPLLTYMAACNGPCEKLTPSDQKVWFKIYENGFHNGSDILNGVEYAKDISDSSGWDQSRFAKGGWSVKIPKNLKPGNYLIRHEIIMIELSPPQHYPECAQLTVTGTGNNLPNKDYLVSFPGAYSYNDPGLAVAGNLYSPDGKPISNYTIPGPKVWIG